MGTELTVDPTIDPPPEPAPESLKQFKETEAVAKVWSEFAGSAPVLGPLKALHDHVLPAPLSAANLLFAVGSMLNIPSEKLKDVCGDITWESVRLVSHE